MPSFDAFEFLFADTRQPIRLTWSCCLERQFAAFCPSSHQWVPDWRLEKSRRRCHSSAGSQIGSLDPLLYASTAMQRKAVRERVLGEAVWRTIHQPNGSSGRTIRKGSGRLRPFNNPQGGPSRHLQTPLGSLGRCPEMKPDVQCPTVDLGIFGGICGSNEETARPIWHRYVMFPHDGGSYIQPQNKNDTIQKKTQEESRKSLW